MKKYFILIFLIIFLIIIYNYSHQSINNNITKQEIIDDILTNNTTPDIDESFLLWLSDNYSIGTLIKLDNVIKGNTYNKNIWHKLTGNSYIVLQDLYQKKYDNMTNIKIIPQKGTITISFIGDVSLADNWKIMPKYDERGIGLDGILSKEVTTILKESDIAVANNEFTISNRGEKMKGKAYTFRASPKRIAIYNEMGIDLITLANNHVYDYGSIAFNDMLDYLNAYNIPYIGAGKNIEEAKKPYYYIANGYKIAFVNATRAEKNIMTPGANEKEEGVFRCYDYTDFRDLINDTKKESDFVIALIHWGKEDSHELEEVQKETAKIYLDAGADIIIGTHAHTLQGIEYYNHKPIIYNLGDFIFNSEDKDTGIFQIKLSYTGNISYYFIPAHQKNEYTSILTGEAKESVINNLNSWSINTIINDDGLIIETK